MGNQFPTVDFVIRRAHIEPMKGALKRKNRNRADFELIRRFRHFSLVGLE